MYNKKVIQIEDISLDKILNKYPEEYIYSIYLGFYPKIRTMYYSPFKKENNPSLNFYIKDNKLRFKDYSSTLTGTVVNFVMNLYVLTYNEAILRIFKDLEGNTTNIVKPIFINRDYKPKTISVVTKDYTQEDIDYWEQYYFDINILNKYNIKPCKEVWLSDDKSDYQWYNYSKINPCYRYLFNGKYKCYKPLEKKQNNKWINSCNNIQNIMGLDQLYKSDTLIITKSYKDVICFNEFIKIPSISFHGEGHFIDSKIIEWLKKKYKYIYLFYDNDTSGISQAFKLSRVCDIPYRYIPTEYSEKDISDFIKSYGIKEANKLINQILKN